MLNLHGFMATSAVTQTGGDGSILVALAVLVVVVIVALVRKKRRMSAIQQTADATAEPSAPATQPAAQAETQTVTATVPIGDDELDLNGISERDAAIVMAITANSIGKPPAQLRFHSIKEVKEK